MKAFLFNIGFVFFVACSLPTNASVIISELSCTHPQVCNLLTHLLSALPQGQRPGIKLIFSAQGDAHDAGPTAAQLKTLLSAHYLVLAPHNLQHWGTKIALLRKGKAGIQTLAELNKQGKLNTAHFWFFSDELLKVETELAKGLEERFGLIIPLPQISLQNELKKREEQLRPLIQGKTFILFHDSIEQLLKNMGGKVFVLRGEGHSAELDIHTAKKLRLFLDQNKSEVFWIAEKNILIPAQVKSWKRAQDREISFDPEGLFPGSLFDSLDQFLAQLQALKK